MTAPPAPFDARHAIVELMNGKDGALNMSPFDTWQLLRTRLKSFSGCWGAPTLDECFSCLMRRGVIRQRAPCF
jgi:hypothetical protein